MSSWKKTMLQSGVSLASLLMFFGTSFARDLYWTEQKQILASDIDGSNVTLIFDGETSTPIMGSYAVDIQLTDDHIYWSGHDAGDIWRADRDGSNAVQLVSGTNSSIHSFDIDEDGGKIYFTDYKGRIMVADLADGGNVTVGYSAAVLGQPTGLVIDRTATGDDVEVLTVTANGPYLHRTSISEDFGGWHLGYKDLQGSNAIYSLAYDDVTNIVYYTNFADYTLRSYNLTTNEHELFWTPEMTQPLGVKLSPSRTHLLIAERGRGISGFELANGGYELLIDTSDAHFGVAVTADPGTLEVPPPPPPPPPPAEPGDILFVADFEDDVVGGPSVEAWSRTSGPVEGTAVVLQDTDNVFGVGVDNQFLRVESARHLEFRYYVEPTDIITLSFEYIGREHDIDTSRAVNFNLGTEHSTPGRIHVLQINSMSGLIDTRRYGVAGSLFRFDLVVNNSTETITYDRPDGDGTASLEAGFADLWRYTFDDEAWDLLRSDYQNFRGAARQPGEEITTLWLQLDSNAARRSFDLDNLFLFKGAAPGAHFRERVGTEPEGYAGWTDLHFPGETDPTIVGPEADPDGDGVPNLVEYLLGSDPTAASRANLPASAVEKLTVEGVENDYLTLTFTVSDEITDVEYAVEVAGDLEDWTEGGVLADSISNGDGTTTYIYRDTVPVNDGSRRFMRLNVGE